MRAHILTWLASVLSACLIGAAWVYTHPAPRLVRVDIGTLLDEQKRALAGQIRPGMSPGQQNDLFAAAADYAGRLDRALAVLSRECGCVIVNSAAILRLPESSDAGIPDMTGRVRELIGRQ